MGYVPHSQVAGLLLGANALLLPGDQGPNNTGTIPGKLFEYLGSGRAILCVTPVEGEAAEMVREYGAGVVADSADEESIYDATNQLVAAWEAGKPVRGASRSQLVPLHRKTLTGRLAAVFDAVVSGRPPGEAADAGREGAP